MVFSKISQVAHYAPKQLVTNDDLANIMDTSHEWIFLEPELPKGILSERSLTSDLASRVAEQLLTKSGLAADAIDFIIVATISPDGTMPSTAAIVQATIGATRAFALI